MNLAIDHLRKRKRARIVVGCLEREQEHVYFVKDNGVGFDPGQIMNGNMQAWGLRGMKERITLLGGEFYIGSKPGSGTLILAEVPMERE